MNNIFYEGSVMWSQVDANMHLRHSAYADFAAQARLNMLETISITSQVLEQLKVGPILFREELIYLREVRPNDTIRVSCEMCKIRKDGSRWSFKQELFRSDDVKAAIINVDGAWIDMQKRKLTVLPEEWSARFLEIPRTEDFIVEVVH